MTTFSQQKKEKQCSYWVDILENVAIILTNKFKKCSLRFDFLIKVLEVVDFDYL